MTTKTTKKRALTPAQRRATAYHEAGHAVIGEALGVHMKTTSIVPGEGFDGQVRFRRVLRASDLDGSGNGDRTRLRIERQIMVSYAGEAAQRRHRPRSVRPHHYQSDYQIIADLLRSLWAPGPSADAFAKWLALRTAEMVALHWPQIKRVAAALMERGSLSGEEVREAMWGPQRAVDSEGVKAA